MPRPTILNIAVNVPLSRHFDYLSPSGPVAPGSRVRVHFGRRAQTGLVLDNAVGSDVPAAKLKSVDAVLDEEPILSPDDLWLCRFASDYYHHPIGEVVAAALPALLRQGEALYPIVEFVSATAAGAQGMASLDRAPKQAELLTRLLEAGPGGISAARLNDSLPNWRRAAKPLFDKGFIERGQRRSDETADEQALVAEPGPELNTDQLAAVSAIREADGFASFVLDGVTGSGKTEVYLHLIADVIRAGRQALVLVPEIGLTPQLVNRFRQRLGIEPAVLHSGLGDAERLAGWRRARSGEAPLVLGTRSAVFVPLARPGLFIVDEEHDASLKQQEGFRYSARDLAAARAKHSAVAIVMGSATPSLELLEHCESGRYTRLVLPNRAGSARPPALKLVDTSTRPGRDGLSEALLAAIDRHLAEDGQILLFLNRRGFAPTLICTACGTVAECRRCDARMTVHARDELLKCHHCGAQRPIDRQCADCGADMRMLGEGTQKLEDVLTTRFPGARVRRIDSDSVQRKGSIGEALEAATAGDADILVGTQMLSKGHHFPKLTLVGIVNADLGLFASDFRASERLGQSIIQVAGRAGRETRRGEVLIQTAFPEHGFWRQLIDGGYARIAKDALDERRDANWPPFARLALLRSSSHRQAEAIRFLATAKKLAEDVAAGALRVLGPVEAPMARRAGRFRAQLLLQTGDRQALHDCLRRLRPALEAHPDARRVRWSIDVDPIDLV